MNNEYDITGFKISNLTLDELLASVLHLVRREGRVAPAVVMSANVHSINSAHKYQWLSRMNERAELVRNDSAGVQLAGRILGVTIKQRMTWADFGWDLAEFCQDNDISMYFLGGREGVANRARSRLVERFPRLRVLGAHHGFFDKTGGDSDRVVNEINQLGPDILVVGFGVPIQERWILENQSRLATRVIMTGGNCFSFLAGIESRAPQWMHQNGLEWLYRLMKEPFRMSRRYILGNPLFLIRVIRQRMGNG
ncbi:WecB/TagA/CpsF family glycosyltransferase [Wenzhouxiangella sediminis]|uniref:Glycosyltransferase n=1 Tax=Wenzhouxiangella sediminis TaxID=1792836 RepID=A0A3E1K6E9_9GAMM|nr:WecB/TagA/CpsF family glycosyltransferase [Wenzhouxiangella sediminis]RFF29244.1 glycosyltransferase [Wenzhouxiangella sediminis]